MKSAFFFVFGKTLVLLLFGQNLTIDVFFLLSKLKDCAHYSSGSFTLIVQKFNAQRAKPSPASQIYSIQNYPLKVVLKL